MRQRYHDAFEAAADCIEAADVGGVHIDDLGYRNGIRVLALHAEGGDSEPYDTAATTCANTYLSLIEIAYLTQTKAVIVAAQTDAEFRPLLLACARAKGLTVADDASIAGILDAERGALPYAPIAETCGCTTGYTEEKGGSCA